MKFAASLKAFPSTTLKFEPLRNHNTRKENKTIKSGEVPEDWMNKPNMRAQKDTDARWSEAG
jgi:hypothetical protein